MIQSAARLSTIYETFTNLVKTKMLVLVRFWHKISVNVTRWIYHFGFLRNNKIHVHAYASCVCDLWWISSWRSLVWKLFPFLESPYLVELYQTYDLSSWSWPSWRRFTFSAWRLNVLNGLPYCLWTETLMWIIYYLWNAAREKKQGHSLSSSLIK